ncbi:MAG: tRNA pseudouridine(38-40) synthase TruA [Erysipelotrichia bacterium]|nr:tRNA pseudouridine(38-40) synthase TruA [Erysipelotrichia bacterium]NCC54685.1 tRNA pseudouridine(38-40) synthase TruA [Erysipelotrichia bacterium]
MTRFKVTLSYNGANYHGWQTQHKNNSVQEQIERVLSTIHGTPCEIHASGRTDAKVHALGQVFHFDSNLCIDANAYVNAMNALLPKDIRILQVKQVDDDFHARFGATSKRYDYYLNQNVSNPFLYDFMGMESKTLDIEEMCKCAKIFIGTHDFTSFTSSRIDPRKSRIKTITRLTIAKENEVIHFILEGNGFLRYMVRMIVQTIIEVGKHRESVESVQQILLGKDKHLCKYKAQPQGLYLVHVSYNEND